jgi:REDY-like protein HapK
MAIVRFVFAALKPGVDAAAYEKFEREVDYAVSTTIKSIVSYRTHRITEAGAGLSGGPWDYVERIEVTDRASYEAELAEKGKDLLTELYDKYLEKSKTVSVWSERIEP